MQIVIFLWRKLSIYMWVKNHRQQKIKYLYGGKNVEKIEHLYGGKKIRNNVNAVTDDDQKRPRSSSPVSVCVCVCVCV